MNRIIILYASSKMFKYNSVEDFERAISNKEYIPSDDEIIKEAYIDDNLVDAGNIFINTLEKLKLVLGI